MQLKEILANIIALHVHLNCSEDQNEKWLLFHFGFFLYDLLEGDIVSIFAFQICLVP